MKENNTKIQQIDWLKLRREWPLWLLMGGALLAGILLYPDLPDRIPSHWNIYGQIDGYSSRAFGAFFVPLLMVGIYLLMVLVPLLDPRRENYSRFAGAYTFLRWALVLFMLSLYVVTLLAALGYIVDISIFVKAGVAVLFIIIGNFMGQFRHNYFVGIKTPWTLANEDVWQRTHRMGGRLWVASGLVCLALSPVNAAWSAYLYFAVLLLMTAAPIAYSYLLFTRWKKGQSLS